MSNPQTAFVAYPSSDPHLVGVINDAVGQANGKWRVLRYEQWEFNDIPGQPVISPIISRINESAFIVADVTYLNLNVVYEIGFAIGRKKRAFLIRNSAIEGDKALAKSVGIFDTLGYQEYGDATDLMNRLCSHIDQAALPVGENLDRRAPVYIVEPTLKGAAATMMVSRLKKARYQYRSFNPTEDFRLSASDAIRQVSSSAGILLALQSETSSDSNIDNLRAMFVAGLAHGMSKPTLILAPAGYVVPLDIRDEAKPFRHPDDIVEFIGAFSLDVTDYLQQSNPVQNGNASQLRSLSIGDPTAENEMTTLGQYYLQTSQYSRSIQGDVNLIVGRKGSGKTALFIRLRDKIRADKRNVVVDLKPEGYQLIKLKEDVLAYLKDGARQHLIIAFWEYLILLEVAYKLLEKDRPTYKFNHEIHDLYIELEEAYGVKGFLAEGDFSERLLTLSQNLGKNYQAKYGSEAETKLTTESVTELLHHHDIRQLRDRISKYLEKKESVWVLFDNLDKGWSTQGVDVIDVTVLRCLIDAGRRVERDMRKAGHAVHSIVFVRNDVYEHLMKTSADYGKEMRAVLDWTDPDLLREMLRLRLVAGLDGQTANLKFEEIWPQICTSHYKGEDTSAYFIDRSLMRPRNVLKIFSHCRGFANNFNRPKIVDDDIEKGLLAYSHDLLVELDRELADVFPIAKDLLYQFIDAPAELSKAELETRVQAGGIGSSDTAEVVAYLLYYGVLGLRTPEADFYIFNVNYDQKMLRFRAERMGDAARYVINPAFWPALGIRKTGQTTVAV